MGMYLLLTFGLHILGGVSIRKHDALVVECVELVVKNTVLPTRTLLDGVGSQEVWVWTRRWRYPLLVSSRTVYGDCGLFVDSWRLLSVIAEISWSGMWMAAMVAACGR